MPPLAAEEGRPMQKSSSSSDESEVKNDATLDVGLIAADAGAAPPASGPGGADSSIDESALSIGLVAWESESDTAVFF